MLSFTDLLLLPYLRVVHSEIMGAPQVCDPENFDEAAAYAKDRAGLTVSTMGKRACPLIDEASLTPVQRKRFAYFKQLRIFVTNLTHICERLRLVVDVSRHLWLYLNLLIYLLTLD